MEVIPDIWVDEFPRPMLALERALLRRGVRHRDAALERCHRCRRTPLVGERVYLPPTGPPLCELCRRADKAASALASRVVRGPDGGRAIRVLSQRAA